MSDNFFRLHRGLNFTPQLGTPANLLPGDIWYLNSSNKFQFRLNTVTDNVVGETTSAALTNKTISGASNTLSNITYSSLAIANSILGSDIATTAAIPYSKLNLSNTIVNADVFATAAIDGTKINPNFGSQNISTTGNTTIGGVLSTTAGSDNTGTGTLNDVSTSATSFFRFTNNTGPTITGLANGVNGKRLTLAYIGTGTMQINNNDALSVASNRIITGTDNNLTIQSGANIELIYDNSASLWRVVGGTGGISSSAVGDWQSYTPIWTGSGLTLPAIGNGTLTGFWRRVGDSAQLMIKMVSGTTTTYGNGFYNWSLPAGLVIDTSKLPDPNRDRAVGCAAYIDFGANVYSGTVTVDNNGGISILGPNQTGSWSFNIPTAPTAGEANNIYTLNFQAPIIGWSSNIVLAETTTEWAYNTGSVTSAGGSDLTSFAYGPAGTIINSFDSTAVSSNTTLRCRFTTPIQDSDIITLEFYSATGQGWSNIDDGLQRYTVLNTARYGVNWGRIAGNSTDVDVVFGNASASVIDNTYGGTGGDAWSFYHAAGHKWRIRKSAGVAAIQVPDPTIANAISTWQEFSPVVTGSVSGTLNVGTGGRANHRAFYRQVGDSMDIIWDVNFGTTGITIPTGDWHFSLPSGFQIDPTKLPRQGSAAGASNVFGSGILGDQTATQTYAVSPYAGGVPTSAESTYFVLAISQQPIIATVGQLTPFTWAISDWCSFHLKGLPIVGWSANINMQNANEEFASNTSTTDADDLTSFTSGANGSLIPTIAASSGVSPWRKRVRFTTPIQTSDILSLELQTDASGTWGSIHNCEYYGIAEFENLCSYGLSLVTINSTDVDVRFHRGGRQANASTFGAIGPSYPSTGTDRWRVRKVSAPGIVGFQPLSSDVKGVVDGSDAPAGFIGEYVESIIDTATNVPGASNAWGDCTSITLSPGDWDITFQISEFVGSGVTTQGMSIAILTVSGNSPTGLNASNGLSTIGPVYNIYNSSIVIPSYRRSITSTTTYYGKLWTTYSGGTPQFVCHMAARRVR